MAEVTVHLPLRYGHSFGRSELMETTFEMDFLPDVGEKIQPLKNDEESGLTFEVFRRHWNEHGKTILETHTYILDPVEDVPLFRVSWWRAYRAWSTCGGEHDLEELLLANGWWRYGDARGSGLSQGDELVCDEPMSDALDLIEKYIARGMASVDVIVEFLKKGPDS